MCLNYVHTLWSQIGLSGPLQVAVLFREPPAARLATAQTLLARPVILTRIQFLITSVRVIVFVRLLPSPRGQDCVPREGWSTPWACGPPDHFAMVLFLPSDLFVSLSYQQRMEVKKAQKIASGRLSE